jgi:hypothetical protein
MEKRQFTRITVRIPAILSLHQIDTYRSGELANICAGGCFFPEGAIVPEGEPCQVTITLGSGINTETMTFKGEIIRSNPAGTGIRFTDNPPEAVAHLAAILAVRAETPHTG